MNMKLLAVLILLIASAFAAQLTSGADDSNRPVEIQPENWIAINENLGFVVVASRGIPASRSRQLLLVPPELLSSALLPPVKGYFMAKGQYGWQRLSMDEPMEFTPLHGAPGR
jgi:hypothetical protein